MANIADMIKKAKEEVGTSVPDSSKQEEDQGIQIERQNVEHIRGQAKSGKDL